MKRAREIVQQVERARIAVRLKENVHASRGSRISRPRAWRGSRSDGGRSRRPRVTPFAVPRSSKRRPTPVNFRKSFADHIRRDVQFQRDRNGRRRIQHVVLARDIQMEFAEIRGPRAQS